MKAKLRSLSLPVLLGLLSLATVMAPAEALAVSNAGGSTTKRTMPWTDKSYDECGQRCIFERANENIGLQAVYLLYKIKRVQGLGEGDKLSELGDFCDPSEDGDDCFKRYKSVQVQNLYAMRGAMVRNSEMITRLSRRGKDEATTFVPGAPGEKRALKKPQIPHVVTFEELKKENAAMQTLGSNEYQRWAEGVARRPSRDDFRKISEIPRDPNNVDAGKLTVVGEVDEVAYKVALEKYEKGEKARLEATESLQRNRKQPTRQDLSRVGVESSEAFRDAREPFVDAANTMLGKPSKKDKPKASDTGKVAMDPSTGKPSPMPAPKTAQGESKVIDVAATEENQGHTKAVTVNPDELLKLIQQL